MPKSKQNHRRWEILNDHPVSAVNNIEEGENDQKTKYDQCVANSGAVRDSENFPIARTMHYALLHNIWEAFKYRRH